MSAGADSQRPDPDALAQAARERAFEFLLQLGRAARIEEIARHLSLHQTGVRIHLARLEDAGLLVRRTVRGSRGRPHYEWAVAPDARPRGRAPEAHAQLAGWLAGAVAAGKVTPRGLEEYGCEIGRAIAPEQGAGQPAELVGDALAAMGFQPERRVDGELTTFELRNCPYRDAVHSGGRHVCALHAGISRGLLQRLAPGAQLEDFVAKDPDIAGCLIEVAGLGESESP